MLGWKNLTIVVKPNDVYFILTVYFFNLSLPHTSSIGKNQHMKQNEYTSIPEPKTAVWTRDFWKFLSRDIIPMHAKFQPNPSSGLSCAMMNQSCSKDKFFYSCYIFYSKRAANNDFYKNLNANRTRCFIVSLFFDESRYAENDVVVVVVVDV